VLAGSGKEVAGCLLYNVAMDPNNKVELPSGDDDDDAGRADKNSALVYYMWPSSLSLRLDGANSHQAIAYEPQNKNNSLMSLGM